MHRSEWILMGLVAGSGILALIVWLALRQPEEVHPVSRMTATWTLAPQWERSIPAAFPSSGTGDLAIYIDSSVPVGGFLAPGGPSTYSALEALARMAPHHLIGADAGSRSALLWHRIAEKPALLEASPRIGRRFFGGGESRLDLAVAEIVQGLQGGDLEAALVVTDLVTTGEIVGAQGTAQALRAWVESDGVLAGAFDFGLLSIRARYWGIRTATCKAPSGDWACWFSEQRQEWLPLPPENALPLHVLAFTSGRAPARQILNGLGQELVQRGFEVQSELLTEATVPGEPQRIECVVRSASDPEHQQFALFEGKGGSFRCERKEVIQIRCPLPEGIGRITAVAEPTGDIMPFSMEEKLVQLEIDCAQRRDRELQLQLLIEAEAAPAEDYRWGNWSSATDDRPEDLGRTLRLQEFVEKVQVRPSRYRGTVELAPAGVAHDR